MTQTSIAAGHTMRETDGWNLISFSAKFCSENIDRLDLKDGPFEDHVRVPTKLADMLQFLGR
jgi:hypothetical protein